MSAPLISVVIATYQAESTLEKCLESLAAQTFRDFEILVIDGGSRDRTVEITQAHAAEIAFSVSEKDRGIYDAWNKAIARARGEWVFFLGADDELWDTDVFASAARPLSEATENVVYGKVAIVLPDGALLNFEGRPWREVGAKFRHEMTIPHQGTFQRRSLFAKHGHFDPEFKICGDYDFLLRELKDHPALFLPDLTVARMGFGGASSTYANVPRIIDELERAQRKNGFTGPSIPIGLRRFRYFLRTGIRRIFGERASGFVADFYRRLVGKPKLWGRL